MCLYLQPNFKIILLSIFVLCFPTDIFSQSKIKGNREVRTEQTNIDAFHTLSIGNDLEVVLIKSTSPSVTVEADSNLHSSILYQVKDSILNFQVTKIIKRAKEFKVYIRYSDPLRVISLNGNVDVITENSMQLNKLSLNLYDDAKIEADVVSDDFRLENNNDSTLKFSTNCIINIEGKIIHLDLKENSNNKISVNAEDLSISTSESAELDIEGFSYKVNATVSNSSGLSAKNLLTNVTAIKLSEKANAAIQASDSISVDASGSSKLELYGQPKVLLENFSDKATITKKEF
jgi:hypothetical protein